MKLETVLVFRTSVEEITDQFRISSKLDSLPFIKNWTIDLDDIDKVLRVVCLSGSEEKIQSILLELGYFCELMVW